MEDEKILHYLILIPHFLFAISMHEASHSWVALLFGDDTSALQGRLTLNPIKHVDIVGALALFIVGFGWAKPVQVNPLRLKNPKRDDIFISLAGPLSNLTSGFIISGDFAHNLGTINPSDPISGNGFHVFVCWSKHKPYFMFF